MNFQLSGDLKWEGKKIEVQPLIDNDDDVLTAFHLQSIRIILLLTGYKAFPGRSIS